MHPPEEEIIRARRTEACPLHSQTDAIAERQRNDAAGVFTVDHHLAFVLAS
jgi:hypothetical protein